MPGYSPTPLLQKLGVKPSMKLLLLNPPVSYYEWLGADLDQQVTANTKEATFVHLFVATRKELEKNFRALVKDLPTDAILWISWYKKSAGITTDVTEDVIREVVLPSGWVDVKVCAVSEEWSGLKIVKRKELR
jgi:hypothetical protein